ncbi:MAG: M14 family metallopeptidase [Rhodospirillaceae bacterium]|nr:M14 family metallopeptidase [Rhodospirillaceae bacterium]
MTTSAMAAPLSYFLSPEKTYDPAIPTPEHYIAHEVGTRVVRPDQIIGYAQLLDALSDKVTSEIIGYSHERRPIIALVITAPENHAKLEDLRTRHLKLSDPTADAEIDDGMPVVTWLGFGVHGDEVSSLDAGMLAMYDLVAATDDAATAQRKSSIVVLLPSLNPDGFGRASQWMNMNGSLVPVTDEQHREHNPGWPRGRGNHYWFDLNRQWVLQTQPEPQAWLSMFQRWKPNISADFHEMPADSTFFFSPGIATQVNPYISKATRELQSPIAGRFADTLNADQDFYFSEEFFDEFNPAMGSTFPAVNGAVGYLFENRGFSGRAVDNDTGIVTLESRIRRQFRLAQATVEAAVDNRTRLLEHQKKFYEESIGLARAQRSQAYVFSAPGDPAKAHAFNEVLGRHHIRVFPATRDLRVGDKVFAANDSYIVPVVQPQYRVIQNIFEARTQFDDVVFYDVSTWNMPLAFGLEVAALPSGPVDAMAGRVAENKFPTALPPQKSDYAYAFEWTGLYAPRATNRILSAGGRARVATASFRGVTSSGPKTFAPGTIVVPVGENQGLSGEALFALMSRIARDDGLAIHALPTGRTDPGPDLGSNAVVPLRAPKPLIVTGDPIRQYDAGELWYQLDQMAEVATTLRDVGALRSADLARYTHIILPDGNYASLGEDMAKTLDAWVKAGGTLIGTKRGAVWAVKNNFIQAEVIDDRVDSGFEPPPPKEGKGDDKAPPPRQSFAAKEAAEAGDKIRGTIFQGQVDRAHPIGFGGASPTMPVFRDARVILGRSKNPFATVVAYADAPQLAGYVSAENLKKLAGSAAVIADRRGKGSVILFADDPAFRAYWHGTTKLFFNAIFFSTAFMAEGQRFGENADHEH